MTTARALDTQRLSTLAHAYERDMVRFLCDLIAIPAVSGHEDLIVERIRHEMARSGFDEVRIDAMGNILGRVGTGATTIVMDAHVDTAEGGDPPAARVVDGFVYGRGASRQRGGMTGLVYGGKLIYELGMYDDFTLWVAGSVQKEGCAGLAWLHILKEDGIKPDCVLLSEATNLRIHRGHPGHLEIELRTSNIESLLSKLKHDSVPGKGSSSVKAILPPDGCGVSTIHLDRQLSNGESKETALAEIRSLAGAEDCEIGIANYDHPSYTGLRYRAEKYSPGWTLSESHVLTRAAIATYESLFELPPVIGKWAGSTNGVGTMGMGVPTIGFGPGDDDRPRSAEERVPVRHLVTAAQFYAAFPMMYVDTVRRH